MSLPRLKPTRVLLLLQGLTGNFGPNTPNSAQTERVIHFEEKFQGKSRNSIQLFSGFNKGGFGIKSSAICRNRLSSALFTLTIQAFSSPPPMLNN
uniref:Uncharacterized protein n=1 Tax=Ixodes ricinus TaxID=34613 RepID=A0A147BME8_IXORI